MKTYSLIILVCLQFLLTSLSGCAGLSLKTLGLDFGSSQEDEDYESDPVAAAAAKFRRPSELAAGDSIRSGSASPARGEAPAYENITLGMSPKEVAIVWGEPRYVDTAGDSHGGNQRWVYFSGLSSRFGMGAKRVVYFENGQVAGWKNSP